MGASAGTTMADGVGWPILLATFVALALVGAVVRLVGVAVVRLVGSRLPAPAPPTTGPQDVDAATIVRMRRQAQRSVDDVERSLGAAQARGCPVGDLPSMVACLASTGRQLDDELRLAEAEPDAELRWIWTTYLADQLHEHRAECAALRRTVRRLELADGPNHLARAGDPLATEMEAGPAWGAPYGRRI
ncbi:hypothetical protein FE374_00595 [Georgenia yuyongxinii]|uniref:Uncharacterized protein n=1 Tax=Georgenia yuyongxinii TaxID=2589797 RepID=A0A5B8BY85_9MICO|nr:hypothetical protein [Georgenia yuyongxinii]QDC23328.1 hypothetical protein FE374_00595 [Georgenia yuyongxinii]